MHLDGSYPTFELNGDVIAHFVQAVVAADGLFLVVGDEGVARVPSPDGGDFEVELAWTSEAEALKWADALVTDPAVVWLSLADVVSRYLPALEASARRLGGNWSAEPEEPVVSASEMHTLVMDALADGFAANAHVNREVWVLRSAAARDFAVYDIDDETSAIPVFADREQALVAAQLLWPGAQPQRLAVGEFLHKTLMQAIETRRSFAPAFRPDLPPIVLKPWDMKALFQVSARSQRSA